MTILDVRNDFLRDKEKWMKLAYEAIGDDLRSEREIEMLARNIYAERQHSIIGIDAYKILL